MLSFSHNQKNPLGFILNCDLFVDIPKAKFDIATRPILRPKQLWSTTQHFYAVLTQENPHRNKLKTAQDNLVF